MTPSTVLRTEVLTEHGGPPELLIGGRNPAFARILDIIDAVAPTESTVLLQGESGTGKDIVARLIHQKSQRSEGAWVAVDCGSIPQELMESELFGHEKGAFTGALAKKDGLCLAADGGTLFLDEIGEMPLPLQVKLLRVLQSGLIRPVGANVPVRSSFRVFAATNRDLREEVRKG
ncbi:MAG: sigma-54 factor interaction domain-containing protein, partial [Planctomycetota bacterium]